MQHQNTQSKATLQREGRYNNLASDENQLRQLMEDLSIAVQRRDLEGIMSVYTDDVVFFDVRDNLQIDKEGLRKSWQECFDTSTEFSYKIKNLHLKIDADVAFSFCLSHSTGKTNEGEGVDIWLRVTNCYVKQSGRWLVCHEHDSVPGDFSTGKLLQEIKPAATH